MWFKLNVSIGKLLRYKRNKTLPDITPLLSISEIFTHSVTHFETLKVSVPIKLVSKDKVLDVT